MRSVFALASLLAAVAVAQQTTKIPVVALGQAKIPINGVVGSVVDANADATTIAVECSGSNCPIDQAFTVTEGPSTWSVSAVYSTEIQGVDATVTVMQDCDITKSTEAAKCSLSESLEASANGQSTGTTLLDTQVTFGPTEIRYQQLRITGGIDQLKAPEATETPNAAGHNYGAGAAAAMAAAAAMGLL
jgi:hypothetical protein